MRKNLGNDKVLRLRLLLGLGVAQRWLLPRRVKALPGYRYFRSVNSITRSTVERSMIVDPASMSDGMIPYRTN